MQGFAHTLDGAISQTLSPRAPVVTTAHYNPSVASTPSAITEPFSSQYQTLGINIYIYIYILFKRVNFHHPGAHPRSPMFEAARVAPSDGAHATAIVNELLSEIERLNRSMSSLREEQTQLRERFARLRDEERGRRRVPNDPSHRPSSLQSVSPPPGAFSASFLMPDRTDVRVGSGSLDLPWLSIGSSGTPTADEYGQTLDVGLPVPFAIDDARKPFIVARFHKANADMSCIAVSESFCQLLGFKRVGGHFDRISSSFPD